MKPKWVRRINRWLKPLNLRLTRTVGPPTLDQLFRMQATLARVAQLGAPLGGVIDIGASDGKWSKLARTHFADAQFLAVDPLVEREPALASLSREWPGFRYAICAAGASEGTSAELQVTPDLDGSTVNSVGAVTRVVPVRSIDSMVKQFGLRSPYLMKFDTHGYELPILSGAVDTLARTSIVIMEVYNYEVSSDCLRFPSMCAHMESLGFRCCDLADPLLRQHDHTLWQMDLVFCRSSSNVFRYSQYR